jgi:hypothetical protein
LVFDPTCDGAAGATFAAEVTTVHELPPEFLAMIQDMRVAVIAPSSCRDRASQFRLPTTSLRRGR